MTSVLRGYYVKKEGLTQFVKPESPCYDDNNINLLFIPIQHFYILCLLSIPIFLFLVHFLHFLFYNVDLLLLIFILIL